jgi:hypothetical protein
VAPRLHKIGDIVFVGLREGPVISVTWPVTSTDAVDNRATLYQLPSVAVSRRRPFRDWRRECWVFFFWSKRRSFWRVTGEDFSSALSAPKPVWHSGYSRSVPALAFACATFLCVSRLCTQKQRWFAWAALAGFERAKPEAWIVKNMKTGTRIKW